MAIDHQSLYVADTRSAETSGVVRRFLRELSPNDWLVFAYLVTLTVIALRCPPSPHQVLSVQRMASLLVFLVATLIVVRGGLVKHGIVAPLMYRVALYGTVQVSYFFLTSLLPLVNPTTLDAHLHSFDLAVFGFEPAVAMDAIVSPVTTEWFAFFYFGYFFLLAIHVIPILLFSRSARFLGEFALGMLTVFCVGHVVYMLVPGYGPYRALAGDFQHQLPHGMWRDMVMATVASGGAQMDIFPSLHTAAPTFITLFSFQHRDKLPFRYSWPVVAFFAVNIIGATMFLRWHYVIDVVAGLALASGAFLLSRKLTGRELARRAKLGLTESWPRFHLR
jgi:hypothetical protein